MRRAPERNRLFDKAAENSLGKIGLGKTLTEHCGTMWKIRNLKKKGQSTLHRRRKKQIEREKDEMRRNENVKEKPERESGSGTTADRQGGGHAWG